MSTALHLAHTSLLDAPSCDLLALFLYEGDLLAATSPVTERSGVDVAEIAREERFEGKRDQTILLRGLPNLPAKRLLLVGLGQQEALSAQRALETASLAMRRARSASAARVTVASAAPAHGFEESLMIGLLLGAYQYTAYKTTQEESYQGIESITIASQDDESSMRTMSDRARTIAAAITTARDLVNTPPQDLYPESMAERAVEIATAHGLEHDIIDDRALEERGFNLLMAVGKGSAKKPRLIHLTYTPDNGEFAHTVAFVGKGVTFDTGGNNIKTGSYMYHMHSDMGGGAAVLGAAHAIGALKPAGVRVHFLVPAAENSISGDAMRPNDVYRGYGGKTVEIENTDAEGRLCLADALAYAQELGAQTIVDLATLTGACVVALGDYTSGMFTDSDELLEEMKASIEESGEDFWRLPLHERLDSQLDSQVADMKNIGKRYGGAITAALFLKRWVEIDRWAHLDIAAPAYFDSPQDHMAAGGTGFGVSTLLRLAERLGQ